MNFDEKNTEKDMEIKNLRRKIEDLTEENSGLKSKILKEYIPLCTQRKIDLDLLKNRLKLIEETMNELKLKKT